MASHARTEVSGFHHSGVTVTNLEVSLAFYRDVLGLELRTQRRVTEPYVFECTGVQATALNLAFLGIPGSDAQVELLEYEGVEWVPAASRPSDPGNVHLCLIVDDLNSLHARLVEAGFGARSAAPIDITVGPNTGGKMLYAIDPDGSFVELFEPPQ